MSDITKIDKNFAANSVTYDGMKVFHVTEEPFKIYGLWEPKAGQFQRMPTTVAENVNDGVKWLYRHTAGGRIRFRTDSKRIVLRSVLPSLTCFNHMPFTGSSLFDLYVDGEYNGPFDPGPIAAPRQGEVLVTESTRGLPRSGMHEVLIHFPLYNEVQDVFIALDEGATVLETQGYADEKPIVFYGSSITQGGCASHPGNAYQSIISRDTDLDHVNLGFSGNCLGELEMAEYISNLDMKAFVLDYDHNAPTIEHLEQTHERFFRYVRERCPDLPILMISEADISHGELRTKRKEVILKTYQNALDRGDKNVWFLDGETLYEGAGIGACTVDGCHPNDFGFWRMAKAIEGKLKEMGL